MNDVAQLKQQLNLAVLRAENSARSAQKAVDKIKKIEKKILKSRLRIKTAEKIILDQQRLSEAKTNNLLDQVINIATKTEKKHKALKKLTKNKQSKISK